MNNLVESWASAAAGSGEALPTFLRLVSPHTCSSSEFVVLDLLGVAMIWAGGWLESRWRRHRLGREPVRRRAVPTP